MYVNSTVFELHSPIGANTSFSQKKKKNKKEKKKD